MYIGVPTEVKPGENRVGLVPAGVRSLVAAGHQVGIQMGAGKGAGIEDAAYVEAGAKLVEDAKKLWEKAEMVVKVKEPIASEYPLMREGQIIYAYFHLAAVPELAKALVESKAIAVAYETIQLANGCLPLLRPMSEIAGKMAIQVGARCLERRQGGKGILLGGVPGVRRGKVAILGAGSVGLSAAKVAHGMGAQVSILDTNVMRLVYIDDVFNGALTTLAANPDNISLAIKEADLVVGAILLPGAKAPRLVTREQLSMMGAGSVIVDVSVDQGGCFETTKATTHEYPTYVVDGIVHYGVSNMPGAVPQSSTYALTNVTTPYALLLANHGAVEAAKIYADLALGLNSLNGHIVYEPVAEAVNLPFRPWREAV